MGKLIVYQGPVKLDDSISCFCLPALAIPKEGVLGAKLHRQLAPLGKCDVLRYDLMIGLVT